MNYHANTPSRFSCTRCGAKPGEPCRTKSGRVASQWHDYRETREWLWKRNQSSRVVQPTLIQRAIRRIFRRAA